VTDVYEHVGLYSAGEGSGKADKFISIRLSVSYFEAELGDFKE